MTHPPTDLPPVGVILTSSHWPDRVRVVRVEPRGTTRVLVEAVTLDDQSRVKAEPSAVTPGGSGEPPMRPPRLLDPFMGGATGLEALRLGCEIHAVALHLSR